MELVSIIASLTSNERRAIAAKLKPRSCDEGEILVEFGMVVRSLFIVGSAVLSFTRDESEGEIEILRIAPGDHFGELGLLTGKATAARVKALIPSIV